MEAAKSSFLLRGLFEKKEKAEEQTKENINQKKALKLKKDSTNLIILQKIALSYQICELYNISIQLYNTLLHK